MKIKIEITTELTGIIMTIVLMSAKKQLKYSVT